MGTKILVGSEPERIYTVVLAALDAPPRKNIVPEKWDGKAAERIVDVLMNEHSVSTSLRVTKEVELAARPV
jgi:hypothetical protein